MSQFFPAEMYIRVQAGSNGLTKLSQIKDSASLMPFAKYHYFVLDEVDGLNNDAMKILKSAMNAPSTVWVFTTNNFANIESGVKDRCHCIAFNAAPAANWFPLARRILAHAGISGVTDAQLADIITPCNGSARGITDAIVELALEVRRANSQPHITRLVHDDMIE